MPRSIHCLHCGVSLNLPPEAEGRRVKCPKCGGRFQVGGMGEGPTTPPATPANQGPDSSFELTRKPSSVELPASPKKPVSGDLPVMPLAEGDLRETFDLPMMTESAPAVKAGRSTADATALFDDKPTAPRKKNAAESRLNDRRCPTCGGVVPRGMSICQTCGLDLETGLRVGLDDDLGPPPPPPMPAMPIAMTIIGGLSLMGSIALAAFSTYEWLFNKVDGTQYFIPVAAFGIFAAVQFLRGKTPKMLLVALTLGAAIDLIALIGLPIYNAQVDTQVVQRAPGSDDPDAADEAIKPVAERLDTSKITTGIILLVIYALVCIYLLSPQVQNRYNRKREGFGPLI